MKRYLLFGPLLLCALVGWGTIPGALAEKPAEKSIEENLAASVPKKSDDEQLLRQSAEVFAKAYNARDAKAVAALFTSGGEFVDEAGAVTQGTADIERLFAEKFAANPGDQIAVEIDSLRFLNAAAADEEGRLIVTNTEEKRTSSVRYSVIHVREGGSWLAASARNFANSEPDSAHEHLKQLQWMVGDWVDEGPDSLVLASCRWDDSGNFLLRDYSVRRAGRVVMSGTHRIGWDALAKQLVSWTFDSEGGHSTGSWHPKGNQWILKLTGVSADGRVGTATHIYTNAAPHITKWQAVERTLGGQPLDDLTEISIVRAPGSPESRATAQNKISK